MVGADAAVQADLDTAVGRAGGFDHGAALAHGMASGFLDVDVRAGVECGDRRQRVPMIRGCDDDDFGLVLLQQFAVILERLGLAAGEVLNLIRGDFQRRGVDVAQRRDIAAVRDGFLKDVLAPPAAANQRGAVLPARVG
jgi:hypothetical protein